MIEIKNLKFSYRKQPPLFSNLDLKIEKGSITGLLGKNGAGKTTLLKLISGLLHAEEGSINTLNFNPRQRNVEMLQQVYLVPEEFHVPGIQLKDYISAYSIFYPGFDHAMMQNILAEFQLKDRHNLKHLSYGQKKKFLIAFALASKCSILVLDEPTNGLDIPSKALFRKIMAGSLSEDQMVIISTHQVKDVENLLDQVIVLDEGKVVYQQPIHFLSDNYHFASATSLEGVDVIYCENAPGGYRYIAPATNHTNGQVDLELLFNAIISGKLNVKNHADTEAL